MSLKVLIENYKKFKTNSQGAIELLYDIKAFGQNLSDDSEFTPTEINEILLILSLLLKEPNLNKNEILFTLSRLIYNTNYNCYIDFYPIFSAILYFIINYCVDEEDLIFDKALILIDYLLFQITSVQDFGIIDDTASQELTKICIDIISDNEHIQNINTSLSIIVSLCRIRPNFLKFIHTWSLIRTKKFCQQLLRLLEHTERTVMLNTLVIYLNIASRIDSEINKSFLTETNMNQILEILFVSLNEVTSKFRQINTLPHDKTRPNSSLNGPHHTDINDNTIIHDLNFLLLIMADVLSNAKINAYIEQQTQAWPRFKSCANKLFTMIFTKIDPLKKISYITENSINLGLTLSLHGVCCVQNIILQSNGTGETNYKTVEKKPDHPGIDDVDDEIDLTNLSCMSLDEIRSNTNKDNIIIRGDNNTHISPHSVGELQCILESEQMVSTPYPKLEHYFATTPNYNGISNGKNNEQPLQPQNILNSIHQFRCLMTWIFTGQGTPFLQLIRNNFCDTVAEENSMKKLSSQTPLEDYAKRIWDSLLLNCCADLPSSEFGDSAILSIPKIRTFMYQTLKNEAFLFSNHSNFQNDTNALNVNCCPQKFHPENSSDSAFETLIDDAPIILKPITIYTLNLLKQIFYGNNSHNNNNSKAIVDCVEIFSASCHYLESLIQNVLNLVTPENPNEMEYKIVEMIMNRVLFICTIGKEFNHWILVQNPCVNNVNSILASIIESFTKLFHHLGVWCCSHINNSNNNGGLLNEISLVSLYLAQTICQMTLPHRNRENTDAKIMSQQFSQVIPAMLCGLDCSSKLSKNNNTSINDNKIACLEWLNHCIVWFMRQINLSSSKSQANSAKQLLNTALFCYFNRILLDINPSPNSQQALDTLVSRYKRLLQNIIKVTFEDPTPKNTNLIEYGQPLKTYNTNCISTIKNGYNNFSGDLLCEPNSYKDLVLDIEDILIKLRASLNTQNAKRENNIVNGVNSNRYQILSQNQASNNAEFLDNPVFPIASIIELYEKAKLYFTMRLEMQNVMVKRQTDLLATYQTQLQLSQQTTQLNQNQNLTYRQTISQLQSLCERKSEMLQCHKHQQNQNEMEKQRLNDRIKMQQNALEEMQETVNIESTKRDAVQKSMDTLRTEYESLNEMHQVVLRHFDASKKQLEILRENLANSENNNLTLTKESKEKDLKIKELNAQLDEGRKQYETARKDNAKLNLNIEGLRKEIQALEENKKLLQTQKSELEMLSKRQESQIQQKDEEVSKLRNDLLIYSEITAKINMLTTEIKPKR